MDIAKMVKEAFSQMTGDPVGGDLEFTPMGESIEVAVGRQYDVGINLMQQDAYHMGDQIGKNVDLLFSTHSSEEMKYLIIVNTKTGESIRINFK